MAVRNSSPPIFNSYSLLITHHLLGIYNATGQYYRFAAADSASADFKSKAISLVLAGGIAGGILGLQGWESMNQLAVPFLLLAGVVMLWLAALRRRTQIQT